MVKTVHDIMKYADYSADFNAQVAQQVGGTGLRSRTVSVRIRPWVPE